MLSKISQRNPDEKAEDEKYIQEQVKLEKEALAPQAEDPYDTAENRVPKIVCKESELSPLAKEYLAKLQEALLAGDG